MTELSTCILIPKQFRVIEACAEFFRDAVRIIRHIIELFLHQSLCCFQHRSIRRLASLLIRILIQKNLRLEDLSLIEDLYAEMFALRSSIGELSRDIDTLRVRLEQSFEPARAPSKRRERSRSMQVQPAA